jgi:hypothetical protein
MQDFFYWFSCQGLGDIQLRGEVLILLSAGIKVHLNLKYTCCHEYKAYKQISVQYKTAFLQLQDRK